MITNTFTFSSIFGIADEQTALSDVNYQEITDLFYSTFMNALRFEDEEFVFTCEIHNKTALSVDVLNNQDPEISTGDFFHNALTA